MNSENDGIIAKYYDGAYRAKAGVNLQDVRFYLEQAQQHRGSILEIACGTGRILLEIAGMGTEVAGLDVSADMLSILRTKLAAESKAVQQRVSVYEGDMRSFSLGRTFKPRKRSGIMSSRDCPRTSEAVYPKIVSAPRFQSQIIPSRSAKMMASWVFSTVCWHNHSCVYISMLPSSFTTGQMLP
jgi:SAM-dependent methyltransferase